MPLSDEQFKQLLASAGASTPPSVASDIQTKLDQVIPLPTGTKSVVGIVGAIAAYALQHVLSGDPAQIADWAFYLFSALGGVGVVSKYQRQIIIAEKALQTSVLILQRLEANVRPPE